LGEENKRRLFLNLLVGFASLGFIGGAAKVAFQFIWPPAQLAGLDGQGGSPIVKIPLSEVPVGESKKIRYKGNTYIVVRTDSRVVALSASCTHLGCLINWDGDAKEIICPCHAARFDLNGNVLGGPAPEPLAQIKAVIINGDIEVGEG